MGERADKKEGEGEKGRGDAEAGTKGVSSWGCLKATWSKHLISGLLCQHCPAPPHSVPLSLDCPASCLLFQLIEQRRRWRWRCCHGWLPAPQMKQKVLKRAAASVARQCQVQMQCRPHQQQSSTAAAHISCHASLWQRPHTMRLTLPKATRFGVRLFDTNWNRVTKTLNSIKTTTTTTTTTTCAAVATTTTATAATATRTWSNNSNRNRKTEKVYNNSGHKLILQAVAGDTNCRVMSRAHFFSSPSTCFCLFLFFFFSCFFFFCYYY